MNSVEDAQKQTNVEISKIESDSNVLTRAEVVKNLRLVIDQNLKWDTQIKV